METEKYTVLQDYRTDRLNAGGSVVWSEGDEVELSADDAGWVNRDRPGTLEVPKGVDLDLAVTRDGDGAGESAPAEDSQTSAAADKSATTPASEQVGGKPARGSSARRKDSAG